MSEHRQLRTILFADIAGYTALMQEDEQRALAMLNEFKAILEAEVNQHEGELIQYFGDGALLSFTSAQAATTCGLDMQRAFVQNGIPARVGLHLGEVIKRNDNLFGDGVNLASRIESIAVPGSVLLSKALRDQVKNQAAFDLKPLGAFQFKNVAEPIEVFALANEGLTLPDPKKVSGKLAEKPDARKWLWPVIGVLCVAGLLGIWFNLASEEEGSRSEIKLQIDERIEDKRVTVMVFDNETADPSYDAFGKMISDWVTNGLMSIGSAQVINAANIKEQIQRLEADTTPGMNKEDELGVDVVVKGRYYLLGDQLIIQGNLVEAGSNQVIHALDRIEGPKAQLAELLKSLTQEILGYWAVKDLSGIADSPPKYEAYQTWVEASKFQLTDPSRCISLLNEAYRLDTTFYLPLINLYNIYGSEVMSKAQDSVFQKLNERVALLSPWERLRFQELHAIRDRDWATLAKQAEQRYSQDSSDRQALGMAIIANNYINHPRKALELFHSFDLVYLEPGISELSWAETNLIFPNYQLGNFEVVDSLASGYGGRKIPDALAVMHLKSLARMDDAEKLHRYVDYYKGKDLYNNSGGVTPFYINLIMLCDELFLANKPDLLAEYVNQLEALPAEELRRPKHIIGFVNFYRQNYLAAAANWIQEKIDPLEWPATLRGTLQYDHLSRIGHSYAMAGDFDQAQVYLEEMSQLPQPSAVQGRGLSYNLYFRARILAAMSEKGEAIQSLESSLKEGFFFYGPVRFAYDPFLKPLFGEHAFQSLVEPKAL